MAHPTFWDRTKQFTRIKLCEFETLDAAYEACSVGADALGFHVLGDRDVDEALRLYGSILPHLPDSVDRVLLCDADRPRLEKMLSLPWDAVQLYPDWSSDEVSDLRRRFPGLRWLKVMSAQMKENRWPDPERFFGQYAAVVDGFLLDSYRVGGTGKTADWEQCAQLVRSAPCPVLLAGGLTAANVGAAIRMIRPYGVDVETGVSDRIPGARLVKNLAKCRAFCEAVADADRAIAKGLR
jgi:phosphoribosylanthranilate isomerase